jgi:Mrp family chromosome partitioning ATPase
MAHCRRRDGSGEPSYVVHAGQSDDAGDLSKRDPVLAAHADLRQTVDESDRPIVVAAEFADLADRLLAELSAMLPAVVTFVAAGPECASSHWVEPLAIALLQKTPARLLVVEADSDQPQWSNRFGVETSAGLVEILQSRATWRDCVLATAIPRLDLLPRGWGTLPNLAVSTAPLVALLQNLKTAYSLVLVAAGAIDRPVAETLAAQSDGAVLAVGLKSTPRLAAERAKRLLIASKARILGAIARG